MKIVVFTAAMCLAIALVPIVYSQEATEWEASIVLLTDKETYTPRELCRITLYNNGDERVEGGLGYTVYDEHGRIVYTPIVPLIIIAIEPGESLELPSWPLTDQSGRPVVPGFYQIIWEGRVPSTNEPITASTWVRVI